MMNPGSGENHEAAVILPPQCSVRRLNGGWRSWLTAGVAGETLALAGGGVVRQQRVLLVIAVYGARGDDVVLVLIHQGQLGVVIYCSKQGSTQAQVKGNNLEHTNPGTTTQASKWPWSVDIALLFKKCEHGPEWKKNKQTYFKEFS